MAQGPRTLVVHVVDEVGTPVVGAELSASTETRRRVAGATDANGELVVSVPSGVAVRLAASHPDYGLQHTDMNWTAWSRYDVVTTQSLTLTLRRGIVVHGRLLDASGQARAHERLLLIYAYRGSGPHPLEATTDATGAFAFPRAVLDELEIVPTSLEEWHPETGTNAGTHARVAPAASAWLAQARAGQSITLTVEPYELLAATLEIRDAAGATLPRRAIELWLRGGPSQYVGTAPRTDARGRCVVLMERGVPYELWAMRERPSRAAPWTQGIASQWHGSVDAPADLTITLP